MKKKLIITGFLTFALLFFIQNSSAQQRGGERPSRPDMEEIQKKQLEEMKKELSLTNDQADKIEKIMTERREAMEARMKQDQQATREEREAHMQAFKEEQESFDTKIKAILSDEQKEKYNKLKQEQQLHRRP